MRCYSQGVRPAIFLHHANRSGFCIARRLPDRLYAESRFCLCPSGEGFGDRLVRAMAAGCVPLIIQPSVQMPFEDLLPYERFSIRVEPDRIPHLHLVLGAITPETHARLRAGVRRFAAAFDWSVRGKGLAYEYTRWSLCLRAGLGQRGCERFRQRTAVRAD